MIDYIIKGRRFLQLAGLMLLLILPAGCSGNNQADPGPGDDTASSPPSIFAFGIVEAADTESIFLDFPARVTRIMVKEGQRVTRGQGLAILDLTEINNQIRKKDIEMNAARSRLEESYVQYEQNLKLAEQARLAMERDLQDLEKYRQLLEAGAVSEEEKEQAVRKAEESQTRYHNLQLLIKDGSDSPQIRAQKNNVRLLEEERRQLAALTGKEFLSGNEIISPLEVGVVGKIAYTAGDLVNSDLPLFTLLDVKTLVIKADIAEDFIRDLAPGNPVTIIPLADRNRSYQGEIAFIGASSFTRQGETVVPVEISIRDEDGFLIPGFNVDLEIEIQ